MSNQKYYYILICCLFSALLLPLSQQASFAQANREDNGALSQALKLPIYEWQDAEVPTKAVIIAIHGATLHGGAFDAIAKHLAGEGFLVEAPDLRGFGRWQQPQYDPSTKCPINYNQSKIDLLLVLTEVKKRYPGLKIYCLGESIGANLGILLAAKNPDLIDGLILVSPCVKRIQHLGPRALFDISRSIADPFCPISLNPYITQYISNDPRVTEAYMKDSLCRKDICMYDLVTTLITNEEGIRSAVALKPTLPLLVIAGEQDKIYKASAVSKLIKRIPSDKTTSIIVANEGHLLVETPFMSPLVVSDIDNWLSTNAGADKTLSLK